ncbi:hypothetical protein IW01_04165 [Pectobacterium brasiliense]|uniref:hypothetical protein n=1 Tax=Pectobacterium brasiliense TaxID=180957 RepID=UPI0004E6B94A|nr:hypothetical protein [Pectobacterium brasiliense]KFF72488.1 hypothetical protein IW01_04165 [Pectobacterium brasiliense]
MFPLIAKSLRNPMINVHIGLKVSKCSNEKFLVNLKKVKNSHDIMANVEKYNVHVPYENLPDLKSPSLVRSVMASLPEKNSASNNQGFYEAKNKYHQFTLSSVNLIISLETLISRNESDREVAFKYMKNPESKNELNNIFNSDVLDLAKVVEDKIVDNLNVFKCSIVNDRDFNSLDKARLKSLENTADAFSKRMIYKIKSMTSSIG